jgi:hypothetical protein
LRIVGLGIGKPQVVAQTVLEKLGSLCHPAAAAGLNHAFVRLLLTRHQMQQAGLACTAAANQRHALALAHVQVDGPN